MFLPAMVLVPSFYYSFYFALGIIIGYILCKAFYHMFVEKGKINCIFVDFGKYKFHLHHWIMGVAVLGTAWVVDYFYLPTFFIGVIIGVIVHDIYDFNDWHQVIIKNENYENK
ncbi:MAG: hypothetical protein A2980_02685 [Candidatus Staskawiczbacteria bacterium RIFCSPLOWO2_01_FULL_33_13]|nr:MAG: hypothetical protein A2980_02685 [Candidatus Staskawiczbacteria bacterium RIFCSPLOWO2_01_FULL_33_13]